MTIELGGVGVDGLGRVVGALREWQHEGAPIQLHPGDVGWHWRFGAPALAAALRTWARDGQLLAVGIVDEATEVRLALAPEAYGDEELADRMAADLTRPDRGLLDQEKAAVEAPRGALLRDRLAGSGWTEDAPWSGLCRPLGEPVEPPGVRVEVVGPEQVSARTAVQRAAFDGSTFTDERWEAMAAGLPYAEARCLLAYDEQGTAVAATTVWSAGEGRPGLVEPLGVHRDHRGHGYGRAISLAGAAALRELGCSSILVCTPSSNVGAVATYASAGFRPLPEVRDLRRDVDIARGQE